MFLLSDAARLRWRLTDRLSPEITAFIGWYCGKRPPHFLKSEGGSTLGEAIKKYARFDDIVRLVDDEAK
jgi:hypothetical protein